MTAGHFLAFTALVPDEDVKFSDDASSSSLSLSFAFSLSSSGGLAVTASCRSWLSFSPLLPS